MSATELPPPEGALRPARRRRERSDAPSPEGPEWGLTAQMQELHEVVWSMVDTIADLRDALALVLREVAAVRNAQTMAARDHQTAVEVLRQAVDAAADLCGRPLPDPAILERLEANSAILSELRSALGERAAAAPSPAPSPPRVKATRTSGASQAVEIAPAGPARKASTVKPVKSSTKRSAPKP